MKTYLNKFIKIMSLTAFVVSCSDNYLDQSPYNAIPITDAYSTESQLSDGLNGLYYLASNYNCFGAQNSTVQELLGDHAFVGVSNSNRFLTCNDWTMQIADNGTVGDLWRGPYNIITNANSILATEGKIPDNASTTVKPVDLYAQAKIMRAYSYLTLLHYFSPRYGEGDQTLGVPLPLSYNPTAQLPRATINDVINQVISDLTSAISSSTFEPGKKRVGPLAAKLLLARAYLYKKDYPNAITYATAVLTNTTTTLLPKTGVATFFNVANEGNSEIIYAVDMTSASNPGSNNAFNATWSSSGTYKQNWMTRGFYNTMTPTDARRGTWYVDNAYVNAQSDTPKPIDVRKYLTVDSDIIQLRKTEAVFILAEAQYHTSPATALAGLKTWVNTYRDPAYAPTATGAAILTEILNQKDLEFFCEGLRFFDMKRNSLPMIKVQNSLNLNIPASDYRWILPIPTSEIQGNPNCKQAPGYQ